MGIWEAEASRTDATRLVEIGEGGSVLLFFKWGEDAVLGLGDCIGIVALGGSTIHGRLDDDMKVWLETTSRKLLEAGLLISFVWTIFDQYRYCRSSSSEVIEHPTTICLLDQVRLAR